MLPREHREFMACHEYLLKALRREMDKRGKHDDWEYRERLAIQQAGYQWASRRDLVRPRMADIERLEQYNLGRVDYASKLCLHVAELIYGLRPAEIPS